jgi:hypothetical protein
MSLDAEYVLPLRWSHEISGREAADLGEYLSWLSTLVDVTVVDGSPQKVFDRHRRLWLADVRHLRPEPWPGRNGKVGGVVTGIRASRHENVIIADDDVRYAAPELQAVLSALSDSDLVRPQSVFSRHTWHTRWDTGRSLVNRAFGHDYPGTHGVRRSAFLAMGGYDGDVLFENLELARTVASQGGLVRDLPGTFVTRLPPTTSQFWSQRIRQAYDSFGQPWRLVAELSLLPSLFLTLRLAPWALGCWAVVAVLVAELGRHKEGGARVYPSGSSLWVLPWLLERCLCVWLALGQRAQGGARYGGTRIRRAATASRVLRELSTRPSQPLEPSTPEAV